MVRYVTLEGEAGGAGGGGGIGRAFFWSRVGTGVPSPRPPPPRPAPAAPTLSPPSTSLTGPDRKLFLPGGLLDPTDVPAYLNGTLAGE